METAITDYRQVVRCLACGLNQFVSNSGNCRKCNLALFFGSCERFDIPPSLDQPQQAAARKASPVIPMRQVVRATVVNAVAAMGGQTTTAAKALKISHKRIKQLLREAGDDQDRRYFSRKRNPCTDSPQ